MAVVYVAVLGVDIEATPRSRPWDWYWQVVPADLLSHNALSSIWHLHSQPPLFNAYAAVFFKAFPEHPLQWMHAANILLGSLLSGMMYTILLSLTGHRPYSLAIALLLVLNPSLYLYEAFVLYDFLTAFLVVLSIYLLARYQLTTTTIYLPLFALSVNVLVLTRSLYHLLFVGLSLLLLALVSTRRWRSQLAIGLLISGLSVGWYAKNSAMFGFFGSSSWMGSNLWKIASAGYDQASLQELADREVIPRAVVEVGVFSPPSAYRGMVPERASPVEVLSRDDRHNLTYVDISRLYLEGAYRLIRYDPAHYAWNVVKSYELFSRPSSQYGQLMVNAEKLWLHEWISAEMLQGQWVVRRYGTRPFAFYLLPMTMIVWLWQFWRLVQSNSGEWRCRLRDHCALSYLFLILAYTVAISVSLDHGENHRFKFIIEQPMWAGMAAIGFLTVRVGRFALVAPDLDLAPGA